MCRDQLAAALRSAPELALLCTQNGWIDNETLTYEIMAREADHLVVAVRFEEIIMEGAGCVADRKSCYGRAIIRLSSDGSIQGLEIL